MAIHAGHRKRMKERFRRSGLDDFHDVNILELLLFYCVPQGDTNPTAHLLLEKYGTLAGVLDAPAEELVKIHGVSDHTATLLTLIPQLCRRYLIERSAPGQILQSTEQCGEYLVPYFFGETDEVVYSLCLDAKCKVLDCRLLFRGSVNSAAISIRKIVETALACNATSVVLAHNHTSGIALPSREDEQTTRTLQTALDAVGILLADHIIVADGDFVSMADNGFFDRPDPLRRP